MPLPFLVLQLRGWACCHTSHRGNE